MGTFKEGLQGIIAKQNELIPCSFYTKQRVLVDTESGRIDSKRMYLIDKGKPHE
jgi:hypothetical protein